MAEVALEVIASHATIGGGDQEGLVLRPSKALDRSLVPRYAAKLLACEAVDVYRRL